MTPRYYQALNRMPSFVSNRIGSTIVFAGCCWMILVYHGVLGLASAQSPTVSPLQIVAVDVPNNNSVKEPAVAIAGPNLAMCAYMDPDNGGSYPNSTTNFVVWNGTAWSKLAHTQHGGDPSIVYDSAAGLFVVCTFDFSLGIHVGKYDAATGSSLGVQVINPGSGIDKPWMVLGENLGSYHELYLSYLSSSSGFGNPAHFGRSTDGGSTWVTGVAVGSGFCAQIATAASTAWPAYIAYPTSVGFGLAQGTDLSGGGMQFTVLTASSGANLLVPTGSNVSSLASKIPGPSSAKRVPYLVADKSNSNRIYLVYCDDYAVANDVDILCARADRNPSSGSWTLTGPNRVNDDPIVAHDKDQFQPAAVVDELGRLHVVFYDDRRYEQPDNEEFRVAFGAYYAYSVDGGATFVNIPLTRASEEPVINYTFPGIGESMPGEYCGIATAGNRVVIVVAGTWSDSPSENKSVILGAFVDF